MTNYIYHKINNLRSLLGPKGLPRSGSKKDLVMRVEEFERKPSPNVAVVDKRINKVVENNAPLDPIGQTAYFKETTQESDVSQTSIKSKDYTEIMQDIIAEINKETVDSPKDSSEIVDPNTIPLETKESKTTEKPKETKEIKSSSTTATKSFDEEPAVKIPPEMPTNISTASTCSSSDSFAQKQRANTSDSLKRQYSSDDESMAPKKGKLINETLTKSLRPKHSVTSMPPSRHAPTSCLYLFGFLRPLSVPLLKKYLQEIGGPDLYFHMDHLKSHAFIKFPSVDAAINLRTKLLGTRYPPDDVGRPPLRVVDFIPDNQFDKWADIENGADSTIQFYVTYSRDGLASLIFNGDNNKIHTLGSIVTPKNEAHNRPSEVSQTRRPLVDRIDNTDFKLATEAIQRVATRRLHAPIITKTLPSIKYRPVKMQLGDEILDKRWRKISDFYRI